MAECHKKLAGNHSTLQFQKGTKNGGKCISKIHTHSNKVLKSLRN